MNWPGEDERVARALDGGRIPDDRSVLGLVAVADRVRQVGRDPGLGAAPDFRDALRARLLHQVPRPRAPVDAGRPAGRHRPRHTPPPARPEGTLRPPRRPRRRGAAAILVAAVGLSSSTLVASSGALPGDPLYGLKRRVQGVEVVLARGADARGHWHLGLARTRAGELAAATAGPAGPLLTTLEDMDRETRYGVRLLASVAVREADEARLVELSSWAADQRGLLAPVAADLPAAARRRAAGSLELLTAVLLRVSSLRDTLRCDCPARPADDLGPVPCAGCGAAAPVDPATRAAITPGTRPIPPAGARPGSAPATPPAGGSTRALPGERAAPGPRLPGGVPAPGLSLPGGKPAPPPASGPNPPPGTQPPPAPS